jgi:hypothetical protein
MRAMRFSAIFLTFLLAASLAPRVGTQKPPAAASRARVLLLPRRVVSGERATLAVLDSNGRLTPGATVNFSNGDQLTTDATGRALFVAPLTPGTMLASIAGRTGHVATTILGPAEAASSSIEIIAAPAEVSLTDRFEISGRGFCGDADANQVNIGGQAALVLASSPTSLIVLPPIEMKPGAAAVTVSCAKHSAPAFRTTFVTLELEADSSPLKPGEHRSLTVRVRGTLSKMVFEARNLAPDVAELSGGNVVQRSSNGGTNNVARFDLLGRKRGSFLVSIRLLAQLGRPAPVH